jgi:hypothetical protein
MADPRLDDAAWLHQHYVVRGASTYTLSEELGTTRARIAGALARAGVQMRPQTASQVVQLPQLRDPAFMVARLVVDRWSLERLAREVGCGLTTVRRAVRREPVAETLRQASWDMDTNARAARTGTPCSVPGLPETIVTALGSQVRTRAELLDELDLHDRADVVGRQLARLISEGRVVRVGRGRYAAVAVR